MAVATKKQKGTPTWVARSVSGNMGTKTCGLPLQFSFEPHLHDLPLPKLKIGFHSVLRWNQQGEPATSFVITFIDLFAKVQYYTRQDVMNYKTDMSGIRNSQNSRNCLHLTGACTALPHHDLHSTTLCAEFHQMPTLYNSSKVIGPLDKPHTHTQNNKRT